jgi:CHAT domain-containing protein
MASDVAALEMDADPVILSACNTAAPDGGPFADGFSGLARAFLHAGARSLLVSHWSIASEATVELTTGFLTALRESPNIRRAQALQKSMLKMFGRRRRLLYSPRDLGALRRRRRLERAGGPRDRTF